MKLNHIIILQNKVDLMREADAQAHQESILKFIRGTVADTSPIIPISAQLKYNIDAVLWMNTHDELRQFLVGRRGWKEAYRGAFASLYVKP